MLTAKKFSSRTRKYAGNGKRKKKKRLTKVLDRDGIKSTRKSNTALFWLTIFCSGAAALVFQVLWIKELSLVVGVEIYSIGVAVSAFFAGLTVGSFVIGRWADRLHHPLRVYSLLELGVALFGVAATFLLEHTSQVFATAEAHIGFLAWAIPFALVGVPAFLIGGTLPVAIRSRSADSKTIADMGGTIYAVNAAGAIAGTLGCSFVLLPSFGVLGTAFAAAVVSLTSAFTAFTLSRRPQSKQTVSLTIQQMEFSRHARLALVLYSLAGGVALGYEVVWSQAIVQFLTTRSFAFSIVLATYLMGLAFGSALYARYIHRVTNHWGVFGLLIAAAGLIALAEITYMGVWQLQVQAGVGDVIYAVSGSQFARMCARFFVAAAGMVFIPTVLLGAAFPAALRLIIGERRIGHDVGTVIAINTAGGIVGTLITSFLFLPRLGLVRTLGVLAIMACAIGIVAAFQEPPDRRWSRWGVVAIGLTALAGGVATPSNRLAKLLTVSRGGGDLIFYEESKAGTVAVVQQNTGTNTFRRLYIQGVSNSGDAMPSLRYMRLQGLLPLIIHNGNPRSALVIGFGTGITAGALLQYPELDKTVCAELLPAVVRAGAMFSGNFSASTNPKLELRIRDGRRELMRSAERYDLITLEPPPPSASGVVNLYSRDFYKLAAARLEYKGLFAQWLPLATQNDEDTRSLVRSFLDIFPYATLWTTELHEMLLVGSLTPIELDASRISQRFSQPSVSAALKDVGVVSPAALLATWMMGKEGLERYADGVLPVTDDRPRIEYSSWVRPNEIIRVLPELLALKTEPTLTKSNPTLQLDVDAEREILTKFYAAGLDAYKVDRESWIRNIGEVMRQDRDNPYYQWTVGRK
jgi:spermidine synthase